MQLSLPFEVLYILYHFAQAKQDIYLVGGAVRDLLLDADNELVKDFDFATSATPEQMLELLPSAFYENKFGTVSLTHERLLELLSDRQLPQQDMRQSMTKPSTGAATRIIDLQRAKKIHVSLRPADQLDAEAAPDSNQPILPPFEMTTFRTDGDYADHRRPDEVRFGRSIAEDLERRDFTINAMAISIKPEFLTEVFAKDPLQTRYELPETAFELIDLHQGLSDLKLRVIRTVGEADRRFNEDALRMLRAIRLAVQLQMDIDTTTYFAIKYHKDLLKFVSRERVRDELLAMLRSSDPAGAIEMLDETGLLEHIIPELYAGKGMEQRGHHISDVWTHSLDALRHCPSPDPIVRLATLLHDVGKPPTYQEATGQITFYNHDVLGARQASAIAKRLRLSKRDVQRIFTLVRYHMFHYQPHHTDAAIRRFMRKVGLENIDDILDLREGDRLGSGAKKTSWRLEEMKERIIEQLNQPMGLDDLAINGHDLMTELQLQPGPVLGKVLQQLLEIVLEKPELNEREKLLAEAKQLILA